MTENSRFFSAEADVLIRQTGCIIIAIAIAALGVLSIYTGDFAYTWQPVPEELPSRALIARLTGVLFVIVSVLFLVPRTMRSATYAMVVIFWLWLLLLHVPNLLSGENWLGFFEFLLPVGASMAFLGILSSETQDVGSWSRLAGRRSILFGRACFGVGLIGCGMSHFIYIEGAAQLIPTWMPARTFLAYLTGAGHIAAGVSLLTGVLLRTAMPLLLLMLASFVLLLHVPRVVADPSRHEWTMLIVSSLFNGTAWLMWAAVLHGKHAVEPVNSIAGQRNAKIAT